MPINHSKSLLRYCYIMTFRPIGGEGESVRGAQLAARFGGAIFIRYEVVNWE